jgi:hypothetical protein
VVGVNTAKSLMLGDLVPIVKKNNTFNYINLQYGDVIQEINEENTKSEVNIQYDNDLDYYNDIYSLAALVKSCDIVITCSNVTAHIAGILGVKTYLLVPKFNGKIWYWQEKGTSSSWYQSVYKIEQINSGDWSSSIKLISRLLEDSIKS